MFYICTHPSALFLKLNITPDFYHLLLCKIYYKYFQYFFPSAQKRVKHNSALHFDIFIQHTRGTSFCIGKKDSITCITFFLLTIMPGVRITFSRVKKYLLDMVPQFHNQKNIYACPPSNPPPFPVMLATLNVKSEKWLVFISEKICKKYYT